MIMTTTTITKPADTERTLWLKLRNLSTRIGNTPLMAIEGLHPNKQVKIFGKKEWMQFSGSVKARAAFNIIKEAIRSADLDESKTLLDATSGNTGIAYAAICRELNIGVALCLPENASPARKEILQSLGARIIYTPPFGGTDEAQKKAKKLAAEEPHKYFYANQYTNPANPLAHYQGTGEEIIRQTPEITHFIAGLGTTGTFVGTSKRLKEYNSEIRVISLQPDIAMHGIEGWKHMETAMVPEIYDPSIADENRLVSTEEAHQIICHFATEKTGLSPSSAANIAGAVNLANQIDRGIIVTILPDNADKYKELIKQIL